MNASKGDPNMIQKQAETAGLVFYNVQNDPFVISGFPFMEENGNWNRIPERIMGDIPEGLAWVAPQPSGGMIRFRTDSKRIVLKAALLREEKSALVTPAALSGFCLYVGEGREKKFAGPFSPEEPVREFKAEKPLSEGEKELTLYTPLQNLIHSVEVGLEPDASVSAPKDFAIKKPILFYGSSITCGFCASRPGLSYPARICRNLDADMINFGFGGNAKGDPEIAEVIASLDISCFVMDYDHNAPSIEHLEKTHQPFFRLIRDKCPDLPIILVTSPVQHKELEFFGRRRDVIKATYDIAINEGDENIWFVDGESFFPKEDWWEYTVDNLHPNDNGFKRMADVLLPVIKEAI